MQNDGSDEDITVPAFLVPLEFYRILRQVTNEEIRLNIGWQVD